MTRPPPCSALFPYTTLFRSVHELQGKTELVMADVRALRRREYQIRAESLESRERVVKWQLEIRESERSLEMLKSVSRKFERIDRKSTRLNSSHVKISYAVFC